MLIKISFYFIARICDVNIFRNSLTVSGRIRATHEFRTKSIVSFSFHVSPNHLKFIGNSRRKYHLQICTNRIIEGRETYGDHMCAAQLCTKCRNRCTEIVHRKLNQGKKKNKICRISLVRFTITVSLFLDSYSCDASAKCLQSRFAQRYKRNPSETTF